MAARLSALLPRLAALTVIWLLATSTITFAAAGRNQAATTQNAPKKTAKTELILVVPDVRRQAYVFAKGILEDGGFAWRVDGGVQGYAANIVARQYPAPGTKIEDTGRPTIVLRLERNGQYAERGLPENASAEPGTAVVLVGGTPVPAPAKPKKHQAAPKPKKDKKSGTKAKAAPAKRAPAFVVPGAPAEPLDEMPLPQRALVLQKRMEGRAKSPAAARYWLYQHAWVVTGAKFGWSGGAQALETLIAVDRDLQARWGIGAKSEAVARAALAEVERRSTH
jgi:hypothetical protein